MIYIFFALAILCLILGPQYWARHVLTKYATPREDIPGTGGELVIHLKEKFSLDWLKLEISHSGDHYDPVDKVIRLSNENMQDKSLTAIAVAAHEFGHALQDATNYKPLYARTHLINLTSKAEKLGSLALLILPILSVVGTGARIVPILLITLIFSIGLRAIVHLVTLPVEFDASFAKALPILELGEYVKHEDLLATRKILHACALTYLASSLAGLLNFWRWLRILRR